MNKNDLIFDKVTEAQLLLLRIDASLRKKVLEQLKTLEKELLLKITAEESFTQNRLKSILIEVRKLIEETYTGINNQMFSDLVELGDIESTQTYKTLNIVEAIATDISINKVKKLVKTSLIAGAPSEEWWKRQSETLIRNFEDQMRTGFLLGETNQQLVKRIRGTKDFNYTNGIMNIARRDSEALVRSSVQTVANNARFEVTESSLDFIESYRYVSTLDSRTSDVCIVRDGKRWEAKTKKPIEHNIPFQLPPLHWNCRSTLISEIKDAPLANDATRASKDGPVAATLTFEQYLKSKNKSFAEDVLGKGKAELYLEGKITLRQLLDQSGNPLTLKQLREKYN